MTESRSFARRIFGAGSIVMVSSLATQVLSFFSSPITTRLLTPAAYGASASVSTTTSIFTVLAIAGVDWGYARYALDADVGAQVERFCWQIGIAMAAVGAAVAMAAWGIGLAPKLGVSPQFWIVVGPSVALGVLNQFAMTRQRVANGYRRLAISNVTGGIVSIAATISIAAWLRRDAWALLAGGLCGVAVQVLLQGAPPLRTLLTSSQLDRATMKNVLLLGIPGLVSMPGYWVISSTDRWFLTRYSGAASAGIYSIAFNLAMMSTRFSSALNLVWYPEISRAFVEKRDDLSVTIGRQWTRMVGLLALVWLATTSAGGDVIRLLTPAPYHGAVAVIPWIAGGSLFYGIAGLSGTGMYITGRVTPVAVWWSVASVLSLTMNRLLVPSFGALGAASTLLTSFALLGVATFVASQRRWGLSVRWHDLVYVAILVLVAGIATARPWNARPIVSLLLKLPVGIAISYAVIWRLAPEWCTRAWKAILAAGHRAAQPR